MLSTWVLDLVIIDGDTPDDMLPIKTPLWLVISADGIPQPFSSSTAEFSQRIRWNYAVRLILQVADIGRSYMYFTLCTSDSSPSGVRPLARSKIGLRCLPVSSPKRFTFPLMSISNGAQQIINLSVLATL